MCVGSENAESVEIGSPIGAIKSRAILGTRKPENVCIYAVSAVRGETVQKCGVWDFAKEARKVGVASM